MKTKYWIFLFVAILLLCAGLSTPLLFPASAASRAEILSNGKSVKTVDLGTDQEFSVPAPDGGHNTVTVLDGKIGVTEASCPDHYCMKRGMCDSGVQIVCLPNKFIIRFLNDETVDVIAG